MRQIEDHAGYTSGHRSTETPVPPLSPAAATARSTLIDYYKHRCRLARRKLTNTDIFPLLIEEVLDHCGWEIEKVTDLGADSNFKPILGQFDSKKRVIRLLDKSSPYSLDRDAARRRFTLAHELGHARLHLDLADCALFNRVFPAHQRRAQRSASSRVETEAENFAAELLMPTGAVREFFEDIFKTSDLPVQSPRARIIAPEACQAADLHNRFPDPRDLAQAAAAWRGDGARSLAAAFRVSRSAMGNRLVILGFVY